MPVFIPKEKVRITELDPADIQVPDTTLKDIARNLQNISASMTEIKKVVGVDLVNEDGRFFKRLKKYAMDKREKCITSGRFTNIEYTKRHLEDNLTYIASQYISKLDGSSLKDVEFEFGDKCDWKQGDFGDGGSCLFPGPSSDVYPSVIACITNNNIKTLKFWKSGKGVARAFILPEALFHPRDKTPKKEYTGVALINCYGYSRDVVGRILSELWEEKPVEMTARRGRGMFYMNNGGRMLTFGFGDKTTTNMMYSV